MLSDLGIGIQYNTNIDERRKLMELFPRKDEGYVIKRSNANDREKKK